jgi:hypothetical protein
VNADQIRTGFRFQNGWVTIRPELKLSLADGRSMKFEWHRYCGPLFLRKDGEPMERQPSAKHWIWYAFSWWHEQGKRVDENNNCIWFDPDIQWR